MGNNGSSTKNLYLDAIIIRTVGCHHNGRAYELATKTATKGPMEPVDDVMQYFAFEHLPEKLREASRPFGELAQRIVETTPRNPQRTIALNKLLEAKDAAVRAMLAKPAAAKP